MVYQRLKVVHKEIIGSYVKISFEDKEISKESKPGNFVMVKPDNRDDPLLPRPFAILDTHSNTFDILIKIRGKGTEIIAQKPINDVLFILGPLGKAFIPPERGILAGGGIGIAPLIFLSKWMKGGIALIGAKDRNGIFGQGILEKRKWDVRIFTEDGSSGNRGLVTDGLRKMKNLSLPIFGCGPLPMLRALKVLAENRKSTAYLFLEERMACGMGVCRGCAVKTRGGYKLVCKDGPIFSAKDVIL